MATVEPPQRPSPAFLSQTVADLHRELTDPDSALIKDALTRRCGLCNAPKGVLCSNTIHSGHPLPDGRLIHHGRRLP